MSSLMMTGILLGGAGALAVVLRRRIEEWIAFAALMAGVLLAGFAMADALTLGYAVVKYAGLAALAFTVGAALWKREYRALLLTPGALAFLAMMAIVWFGHRGRLFTGWDDFTHWGLAVKSAFQEGRLAQLTADSTLLYPDYPPLTTLFACFWISLSGGFNEGDALRAVNLMLMVCFLPAFHNLRWRDWKQLIPMLLACLLVPVVFRSDVYQNLSVDGVLAGLMIYALSLWLTAPGARGNGLAVCGVMAALPLVKDSGLALGAIVLAVLAVDVVKYRRRERARGIWTLAAGTACLAAGKLSWSLFLDAHGVGATWEYGALTLSSVAEWLTGSGPLYRQRALETFFLSLCRPEVMGEGNVLHLSFIMWMALFAAVACWIGRRGGAEEQAARCASVLAVLWAGCLLYAVSMLVVYAFSFEPNEAAALSSFDRYMSTYMTVLLGMTGVLLLDLSGRLFPGRRNAALAALAAVLLVANPEPLMQLTAASSRPVRESQELRADIQPPQYILDWLADREGCRVAFVGQETSGVPYYACRYAFSPIRMGYVGSWSIYGTQESADAYRSVGDALCVPPLNWRDGLVSGGFTHVYLHSVNESFAREYGSLFENPQDIAPKTLYSIALDAEGQWLCLQKAL